MVDFPMKPQYHFEDLLEIMRILRAPGGCVWDAEQTHASIRRDFLEETYEVCEAIDEESAEHLCEELGDVLLQVVFHAQMEQEAGHFTMDDVCDGICKKMIYRHPHVFGDVQVSSSAEVLENWDTLKQAEKHQQTAADTLRSVAQSLPALWRAEKVQHKAAKAGVKGTADDALSRLDAACSALHRANDDAAREKALGELLFSAVGYGEAAGRMDCEALLRAATDRFIARFSNAEQSGALASTENAALRFLLNSDET